MRRWTPALRDRPWLWVLRGNDDSDVEVMFSEPVFVEGDVELYVLDPETGGWGLPLLWTLRNSSGVGKGIDKSVVQSGRDFPYIRVGGGQ